MNDKNKRKMKFSDDECSVILQAVENTAFLGKFSESVTTIKKKLRVKPPRGKPGVNGNGE